MSVNGSYSGSTQVNIHLPGNLHLDGGYDHFMGHFGHAAMTRAGHYYTSTTSNSDGQYGSMSLFVELAPSDLCHHLTNNYTLPRQPSLLLVHNSPNCSFVTQTRRAQHLGAAGLLIVDRACVCEEQTSGYCQMADGVECHPGYTIVKDDGSGGDVSIPAILLKQQDGSPLVSNLTAKIPVLMSLQWQATVTKKKPNNSNKSDTKSKLPYGMWLDLHDTHHTPQLTQQMQQVALAVGAKTHFYPSYMFYDGTQLACQGDTCASSCTHQGKYCYPSAHGKQVVQEILHRLCIWELYGDNGTAVGDQMGRPWWQYVTYFDQNCAAPLYGYDDDQQPKDAAAADKCRQEAYQHASSSNMDGHEIQECIRYSGGLDGSDKNNLLERELHDKERYGIYTTPSIWVNGKSLPTYWRAPTGAALLEAVCVGFVSTGRYTAEACDKCLNDDDKSSKSEQELVDCAQKYPDRYDHHGGDGKRKKGDQHFGAASRAFKVVFWLASISAVVGALWFGYKKRLERQEQDGLLQQQQHGHLPGGLLVNALGGNLLGGGGSDHGGNNNNGNSGNNRNSLHGRLLDPILSYMPLNTTNSNAGNNNGDDGINGVVREEFITTYE
ncbi:Vacuolar-sorting receptor [Seminavis robusta]|uniref:Vacuolar-sorting receptor n=1 Tax=Seminavis robusta TaxID=568900 RepID=A0A9N8EX17_9STRA|nr:Vacuolar-sorting receptor [Seminavis robusta]|eukprot:Sro2200_g318820.1 Vacuolar-sorting receptor (607) ;mRNA; f:5540-7360